LRMQFMMSFLNVLWFVKDSSVCLVSTIGERWSDNYNKINRVSRSIINYNHKGEFESAVFNVEELTLAGELAVKLSNILTPLDPNTKPKIIYQYDESGEPIMGIKPKVPENFDYNKQTCLDKALQFLTTARNQNNLIYKIAYYMPIFECLFIVKGSTEITNKMALRVAFYIGKDEPDKSRIASKISKGYNIRSGFLHGRDFEKSEITQSSLLSLSKDLDDILREVFNRIINGDHEIFITFDRTSRELFFNNIYYGRDFAYKIAKEKWDKIQEENRMRKEKEDETAKRKEENRQRMNPQKYNTNG
jgi:hypothetical protein